MKLNPFAPFSLLLLLSLIISCSPLETQSSTPDFPKVRQELTSLLSAHKLNFEKPFELFIRAFKKEEVLEVFARKNEHEPFILIKSYEFCASSGVLGPKRKEGDKQIPEGFYHIDRFNPNSKFHLSLGLNYPNSSDRIKGDHTQPGSDIFIHGNCVTVGCIPLGDPGIESLYTLAKQAKTLGKKPIRVHLFPFRMAEEKMNEMLPISPEHEAFWKELQVVYLSFEKTHLLPGIKVDEAGSYLISE